jgi:hypothetical protein
MYEDPGWQALIDQIVEADKRTGRTSALGNISDYAFKEFIKCPGLVVAVREAKSRPSNQKMQATEILRSGIRKTRDTLCGLHAKLVTSLTVYTEDGVHLDRQGFIGYILADVADSFSSYTLHDIYSGIVLLNRLLVSLTPDLYRFLVGTDVDIYSSHYDNINMTCGSEFADGKCESFTAAFSHKQNSVQERLDRTATSMGMVGIQTMYSYSTVSVGS